MLIFFPKIDKFPKSTELLKKRQKRIEELLNEILYKKKLIRNEMAKINRQPFNIVE